MQVLDEVCIVRTKVGVMGSAGGEMSPEALDKSHLLGKAELLLIRQDLGQGVNTSAKLSRQSVNVQLLEVPPCHGTPRQSTVSRIHESTSSRINEFTN